MKALKRTSSSNRPKKILQFGGGNFLRGYFDWMIDVLNNQTDFNGDVVVVKPTERGDYQPLRDQDGLYHVRTNGIRNGNLISEVDLIECIQEIIHPYKAWQDYLKSAHESSIRFIVSNTTESGIQYNESDQKTDSPPKEFPAKLTLWLYERWSHFDGAADKGCIILPFELIEDNGLKLKECIINYASLWELEEGFSTWIKEHNSFCNTLVDRIVTGFPKENIEGIYETIGFEDKLIVDAEPYHLLVIKGPKTIKSELPFDNTDLNVVFTDDLSAHREVKVRILNGAHTSMVPTGLLLGIESVGDAMKEPEMNKFIAKLLFDNVVPTLDYPEEELKKYIGEVRDRFMNPFIHHKLIDISLNSISKFKTRLLPSLLEYHRIKKQFPTHILTAFSALIIMYIENTIDTKDDAIPLRDNDETIQFFKDLHTIGKGWTFEELIENILSKEKLWGQDLNAIPGMHDALILSMETHFARNQKFTLNANSRDTDHPNTGSGNWNFSLN